MIEFINSNSTVSRRISIDSLRLRSLGYNHRIEICFHVYRFNTNEIRECERFANDLGITPVFYDAFLNDWWQFEAFIQGTLPNEKRREILDDLFFDETPLVNVPKRWRCPQWDLLIIDERGRYQYVVRCQTIIHRTIRCCR